ncbi:alpha/beta fold hydrolase [Noviherbaspirillum pedocola]|uniref:Proline iminopeptidase n=1 Tax=Noviherbaspirillum pedocola TaxID=2801341 RepID=A0A934SZA4_9BURK|nr:alpha/beta fold hydrolase [Noviherbaspirillum pedocola]MBK4738050.1 alpha/beta fold hydrolase [Noviherbaspirillum pedocola]
MDKETGSDATLPFEEARLDSGDGHRLWHAERGSRNGTALFWLHGGPGSGASLRHAALIDPGSFRLVLMDQRGCGRSEPAGAIHHNSLSLLIDDIERLRRHLGIARMLLGGGSWGATLAICYAARYPEAVAGLVLRAPFLAERDEISQLFQPLGEDDSSWQAFAALAPPGVDLLAYAADQLERNTSEARALARAWHRHACLRETGHEPGQEMHDDAALLARYRVQSHYLRHGCFLDEGAVLDMASRLSMPAAIIHGGADRICAPDNARRLAARMPRAALSIIDAAGHDPFHPGMVDALQVALRSVAQRAYALRSEEIDA